MDSFSRMNSSFQKNNTTHPIHQIDFNEVLERQSEINQMKDFLKSFDVFYSHKTLTPTELATLKSGIYLYGGSGIGKTTFVNHILKEMDYNIIHYDAGDIRNKNVIDKITNHNISDRSIISMFQKKIKKNIIVMDEIDVMNGGDKGGLNTLIKLIRPKKTKKQQTEKNTMIPIICIGNYHIDKKIKELMKVCHKIELKTPTPIQIQNVIERLFPISVVSSSTQEKMIHFVQGDLRKLILLTKFTPALLNHPISTSGNHELPNYSGSYGSGSGSILSPSSNLHLLEMIFQLKSYNEDTKEIVQKLMTQYYPITEHSTLINETNRTIVGLLWHENVIHELEKKFSPMSSISFYLQQLKNLCFADYIDKITFQNQIWQFNEMSSLMKTFHNHKLYHLEHQKQATAMTVNVPGSSLSSSKTTLFRRVEPSFGAANPSSVFRLYKLPSCYSVPNHEDIRFTKVLTKYSNEYNNSLFIQYLCNQLNMDKKDLISLFLDLKNKYEDINDVFPLFEHYEINKLNIQRMYRFLEHNIKEDKNIENEMDFENDAMDDAEDEGC